MDDMKHISGSFDVPDHLLDPCNHLITRQRKHQERLGSWLKISAGQKLLYADQLISGRIVDIHEVMIDQSDWQSIDRGSAPNRSVA